MKKSVFSKDYETFVSLLRGERERMGVTQVEMAQRLGETQSFISKCERGERRLDVIELRSWCQALGMHEKPRKVEERNERDRAPSQHLGLESGEGERRRNEAIDAQRHLQLVRSKGPPCSRAGFVHARSVAQPEEACQVRVS